MRAIDLKLGGYLYTVNYVKIEKIKILSLISDAGKIKVFFGKYTEGAIFESPDQTVGKGENYDYHSFFTDLSEAQEQQKRDRLKHLTDLKLKSEKAYADYADAVNEYLYAPLSNPHEQD